MPGSGWIPLEVSVQYVVQASIPQFDDNASYGNEQLHGNNTSYRNEQLHIAQVPCTLTSPERLSPCLRPK